MAAALLTLPTSSAPTVSIVVMVTGDIALPERCLAAVVDAHDPSIACEVVLVVNTTDPAVRSLLREGTEGARVIERDVNTGTAVGWNLGFAAARGRHVALLHEDSAPETGWLEAALGVAAEDPRAAAVGCRLLHLDGGLQGGGIVTWRDGNVSWLTEENAPAELGGEAAYPVSHASSAAMLVERSAWEEVGGFDERYFPAFRVEVDFGSALWSHGRSVLMAPRARVRHGGGAMVRDDGDPLATPLFREFLQETNRERWAAKWTSVAHRYPDAPEGGKRGRTARAAVEPALASIRAGGLEPPPGAAAGPRSERPLTGPGEEGLDDRLKAAHAVVERDFMAWLVEGLGSTRGRAGKRRDEVRRLETELTGRDEQLGLERRRSAEVAAEVERLTSQSAAGDTRIRELEHELARAVSIRDARIAELERRTLRTALRRSLRRPAGRA